MELFQGDDVVVDGVDDDDDDDTSVDGTDTGRILRLCFGVLWTVVFVFVFVV